MNIEYLVLDLVILIFPILAITFTPKAKFPQINRAFQSIFPIAAIFVSVDFIVTNWFWFFNPDYILGLKLLEVPFEEIIFFLIIPYSCLCIWVNLKTRVKGKTHIPFLGYMSLLVMATGLWAAIHNKYYTFIIFFVLFIFILFTYGKKIQKALLYMIPITLLLTFIFNLYLTARPIVLYNPNVISGLRVITIPIEDFVYGLVLIISTIYIYEHKFSKRLS